MASKFGGIPIEKTSKFGGIPVGQPEVSPDKDTSFGEFIEPMATIASSVVAEPIAGIAGIAQSLNPLADEGAGAEAVEATREALTYKPRTELGKKTLGEIGGLIEPAAKALSGAETRLGDAAFEATGSPAFAAAAASVPTAIMESIGIASGRGVLKTGRGIKGKISEGKISRAIEKATPDIDQLKATSREMFKEIDELGARLDPRVYNKLAAELRIDSIKGGIHEKVTPVAHAALLEFEKFRGNPVALSDLDSLRAIAQNAAGSINKMEASLGVRMIQKVDDFLDNLDPNMIRKPAGVDARNIGKRYRLARDMWGRARRSEMLQETFEKARNQASGFENGVRSQFRSILNNRRKSKSFSKSELDTMRKVVRGTKGQNIFKLLGKFGFGEGQATGMLGGSIGVAGGYGIGGPVGAVAVPMIGQVSKKLAQRMTAKGAEFADQVVRAGKNARKITAAYLRNTPKAQRSAHELSELLTKGDIDLVNLRNTPLINEAKQLAMQRRFELAGALAPASTPGEQ